MKLLWWLCLPTSVEKQVIFLDQMGQYFFFLIQHTTALLSLSPQFLLPLYIFNPLEDRAIIITLQWVITSSTVQLFKYEALSGYKSFMASWASGQYGRYTASQNA